ncbi:hypothetical protein V2E24_02430 [Mycoplasmopsis ciconiae]|uniref:Uncharacterized protein n=1 Tax=Mycoplasmopsis ciconiae TaxID=561067 RepID=A0ABU7MLN8_9BACT|nr:hypothetical protein [Mycoplasmopsis ciconiae]
MEKKPLLSRKKYLNFDSPKDLYENGKRTFNLWFMLYVAILVITAILLIVGIFVFVYVDSQNVYEFILKTYNETFNTNNPNLSAPTKNGVITSYIIWPSVFFFFTILSLVYFVISMFAGKAKQNYGELNIVGNIVLFVVFLNLATPFLTAAIYGSTKISYVYQWINLATGIFTIVAWFFVGREVKFIKRAFMFIRMREEMKNNIQFNIPDFENFVTKVKEEVQNEKVRENAEAEAQKEKSTSDSVKDEYIKKLKDLPIEKLKKAAEDLNIFGYEDMDVEELAERIYYYSKKKNSSSQKDENSSEDKQ